MIHYDFNFVLAIFVQMVITMLKSVKKRKSLNARKPELNQAKSRHSVTGLVAKGLKVKRKDG